MKLKPMTVAERLAGCPTGATLDALRLCGHTDAEITAAVASGSVTSEVRDYAMPRNFKVQWFYLNR
jgi:hypothetical protein